MPHPALPRIANRIIHPAIRIAAVSLLAGGMIFPAQQTTQAKPLTRVTFLVNTTIDTQDSNPGNGVCADSGGNCSLRAAISEANATPSTADTITLPAGTYTLTLPNAGGTNEDNNATGDLDINSPITIQGNSAASTIIQAGTTTSNGIDKVFGVNPYCATGINVTISGVTIQYGRNTQPYGSAYGSSSGGGLDWCGTDTETFTLSNAVVANNTNVYGNGGGLDVDGDTGYTGTVTIDHVTLTNNHAPSATTSIYGGGINIIGSSPNVIIQNSTIQNNSTNIIQAGGGIFFGPSTGGSLLVDNSTISGNSSGIGGGIFLLTEVTNLNITIQNSSITGNYAGSGGGGLATSFSQITTNPIKLTNLLISGNSTAARGGGIFNPKGNIKLENSRIVNNSASISGSGLYSQISPGADSAVHNWWGCSAGPSSTSCNRTEGPDATSPWFVDTLSAASTTLTTNQTTDLTASFLKDSAGSAVSTSNLGQIIGQPISWGSSLGSASGSATVGSGATASGTFTASTAGNAIVYAKVDNDSTSSGVNTLSITVDKASTTTAITSDTPDPLDSGQPVLVTFSVTGVNGNSPTNPTGNVTVSDGVDSCTGTVAAGSCTITFTTVGNRTLTATYAGDSNFNGSTSSGEPHMVIGPPSVSLVNSIADTGDGQLAEGEHTSADITQLLLTFTKAMNALDSATVGNYHLQRSGDPTDLVNGAVYNNVPHTVTLNVNGGAALPDGAYTLWASSDLRDTLGAHMPSDFTRTFHIDNGSPSLAGVVTIQNSSTLTNGTTLHARFSSIEVSFNEDVNNSGAGAGTDDVTNPNNYLLLQAGPNGTYDTGTCLAYANNGNAPLGDDVRIPTEMVTYENNGGGGPFTADVVFNNGNLLADGEYRLSICGTTSIVDLAANPLNGGSDTQILFTILATSSRKSNPATGFAPDRVTVIPPQPAEKSYTDQSLWIEIPGLGVKSSITGVPLSGDGWDLTWLGNQTGWLEGTAYPTWNGNTVLTAHNYTPDGLPGPFARLGDLKYGDQIFIHSGGEKYTYAVRMNSTVAADDTRWLNKHEKLDWITLITCQQYDEKTGAYKNRQVVRAVLVELEQE